MPMIDLDVTRLTDRIYALTEDVANEVPPDDISRLDWGAMRHAALGLLWEIQDKIASERNGAAA